jgi:hypothetical protein
MPQKTEGYVTRNLRGDTVVRTRTYWEPSEALIGWIFFFGAVGLLIQGVPESTNNPQPTSPQSTQQPDVQVQQGAEVLAPKSNLAPEDSLVQQPSETRSFGGPVNCSKAIANAREQGRRTQSEWRFWLSPSEKVQCIGGAAPRDESLPSADNAIQAPRDRCVIFNGQRICE